MTSKRSLNRHHFFAQFPLEPPRQVRLFADAAFRQFKAAGRCVQLCRSANGQDDVVLPVSEVFASDHGECRILCRFGTEFYRSHRHSDYNRNGRRCATNNGPDGLAEYVRCFGWPNPPAGGPPAARAAREPKAARRVGAPRPEAQPARARPQAGARGCAEPEEQGGAAQPVTAALLLRRVCRSRRGQADRIAVLQFFRFCADMLPTERCEFVLLSPSYYIK